MSSQSPNKFHAPLWRVLLVYGLIVAVVGALVSRLLALQVFGGRAWDEQAVDNYTNVISEPAPRGIIYDRNGYILARNLASYNVVITPAGLPDDEADIQRIYREVSELTGVAAGGPVTEDTLNAAKLFSPCVPGPSIADMVALGDSLAPYTPVKISCNIGGELARVIGERSVDWPGVSMEIEPIRDYPTGSVTANIVGFLGPIPASLETFYRERGFIPNRDKVGYAGVETSLDDILLGINGQRVVQVDVAGRVIRNIEAPVPSAPGNNVVLTIDTRLQKAAEAALIDEINFWNTYFGALRISSGVVIAMNPKTGEILAMVSLPAYDNNAFAGGIPDDLYQAYLTDPNLPLRNHAISDIYPPGSTFKLVTGLAALQEGVTTSARRWQTYACYQIPGAPAGDCLYDWNRRGFGRLNMVEAFAISSDTFFYQMAVNLGVDRLAKWAYELGFGARTEINLPNEASGIIPSTEWAHTQGRTGVYTGELAQAGIGQNVIAVTPLQLLNAYAAVANGGHLMRPQIVLGEADADGNLVDRYEAEVLHEVAADPANLSLMRIGAREVITTGHAYNISDLRLPGALSGKTGTAEFGLPDAEGALPFHSWFVAWLPSTPGATDSPLAVITFTYRATVIG
ncbi:MAG: penicillin-binding protein 2, partial [Nevskiales bacterium]